ncbi:hypothetical protein SLEP1_g6931 [Rubroshorea leprosula]|uniref:Uncharacterized protein n=1 Tax=Rubroshorea leprosula TaxID=152421 RepID=A0AAV5I6L6_9ROSI|nr:hypothetical protein SLEP1_g6931 [Rubroshorea leprosula]
MMNPFDALKKHLREDARTRLAILFAQIALFTATIFVWRTRLYAEHDRTGFKTALSYQIMAILVSNSNRLSSPPGPNPRRCGSNPRWCVFVVNLIANLICLILTPVFEKFYEKSLSSLGFALSITVLCLILRVIIRPFTDLGLFGFLIGVIVSVAYNLFGLNFQTWIVVVICFLLVGFSIWLDWKWLEVGQDRTGRVSEGGQVQLQRIDRVSEGVSEEAQVQLPRTDRVSEIIELLTQLTVAGFHLFWVYILFRTNCQAMPKSISCSSSSVMEMLASLLIFNLWYTEVLASLLIFNLRLEDKRFGHKLISRVFSLFMMLIILLLVGVGGCLKKGLKKIKKPGKKTRKTKKG